MRLSNSFTCNHFYFLCYYSFFQRIIPTFISFRANHFYFYIMIVLWHTIILVILQVLLMKSVITSPPLCSAISNFKRLAYCSWIQFSHCCVAIPDLLSFDTRVSSVAFAVNYMCHARYSAIQNCFRCKALAFIFTLFFLCLVFDRLSRALSRCMSHWFPVS